MNAIANYPRRWIVSLRRGRSAVAPVRASIALLVIIAYLGVITGYPAYRPAAKSASDGAFPCQFSHCGCQSREQCRTNCCCHSKSEKIAWALARGIDPNTVAVLSAAEQAEIAKGKIPSSAPVKSCCQSKVTKAKKSCCAKQPDSSARQLTIVLGIEAQKCSGNGVEWIQAGYVALPPPAITLDLTLPEENLLPAFTSPYLPPTLGQLVRPG